MKCQRGGKEGKRSKRLDREGRMDEWKKVTEKKKIGVKIKMNDVHSPVRSAAGSRVVSSSQRNKLTDVGTNTTQQKASR